MAQLYSIIATGQKPEEAQSKFETLVEELNDKLREKKVKLLPEPQKLEYSIACDCLLPEGASGAVKGTGVSQESFEDAELEASKAMKYNYNISEYKIVADYKLTKKQYSSIHAKKKTPTACGDLEETVRYDLGGWR